ncbi:MAG: enoyl-CoA hydratase-related protein [Sphingorhabdus sp.]
MLAEAYTALKLRKEGEVLVIELARPQALNAFTPAMLDELRAILVWVRESVPARAILLTGQGRAFCAGMDIADGPAAGDTGAILETHLNPLLQSLIDQPIPVISAVNGVAAGAGCSIALASDIVIASRNAFFLQAFVNIGFVPDTGATWLLPRLAGRAKAMGMMMLGERVSAEQADAWGLVWKVAEPDDLHAEAMAIAQRLAAGPTVALRMIRQGIHRALHESLAECLVMERDNQRVAGTTADYVEGVNAFKEKRQPRFEGF